MSFYKPIPRERVTPDRRIAVWYHAFGECMSGYCRCGAPIYPDTFESGHVKSHKHGGDISLENLQPICRGCNRDMRTHNMDDWYPKVGIDAKYIFPDTFGKVKVDFNSILKKAKIIAESEDGWKYRHMGHAELNRLEKKAKDEGRSFADVKLEYDAKAKSAPIDQSAYAEMFLSLCEIDMPEIDDSPINNTKSDSFPNCTYNDIEMFTS